MVGHCAEDFTLCCAGIGEQGQGFVGVGGENHFVKAFGMGACAVAELQRHALFVPPHAQHRGVEPAVRDLGDDFFHILARATRHGPPGRAVAHLHQAVVVAKADHGGHRKVQHLLRRAAPNAAQHGQKIPIAKLGAKALLFQKCAQRLGQLGLRLAQCNAGTDAVKAQDVAQHPPKTGAQRVGGLCKNRRQTGAAPLQLATAVRHLDRERHIRFGAGHAKLGKQLDQLRVGAFIENQEPGVHAMCAGPVRGGQGDVNCVGVAAKVVCGFEKGDGGPAPKAVGCGETRNP